MRERIEIRNKRKVVKTYTAQERCHNCEDISRTSTETTPLSDAQDCEIRPRKLGLRVIKFTGFGDPSQLHAEHRPNLKADDSHAARANAGPGSGSPGPLNRGDNSMIRSDPHSPQRPSEVEIVSQVLQ